MLRRETETCNRHGRSEDIIKFSNKMATRKGQRHIGGVAASLSELTLDEKERWTFPAAAAVIHFRGVFLAFHFSICCLLPL